MTDELYDPRLLVRGMYRIYCVGWNGMYWLNSRNWIRASLELAFGGRWWHVSTWQWMALATSFQDRGGKVGKLTKQFWWNLGVQPETKILSESIVSVERFDYSGYQCRFNRRHAQYNKHILLIYHYIYIYLYCVLQQIVLPIIWWFHRSTIYTPDANCQESIFQDAASKPQKEGGRFVTKRDGFVSDISPPLVMDLFFFQRGKVRMEIDFKVY